MAKALLGKAFGIFRGYATEPLTVAFSVIVLPVFLFAVWWLVPLE